MESIKNNIIFILLFLSIKTQIPSGKVFNTCGKKGYDKPEPSECKQEGEICCYISIKTPSGDNQEFCHSAPSMIEKSDVDKDIKSYTGYEILDIKCNKSIFIKNKFLVMILLFFILF